MYFEEMGEKNKTETGFSLFFMKSSSVKLMWAHQQFLWKGVFS